MTVMCAIAIGDVVIVSTLAIIAMIQMRND